jgi:hypothetical protein
VAGWPWVRDSIATSAWLAASASRRETMASMAGSSTLSRPPLSMRAWARLLMSSEVHAKWMNSAADMTSGLPAKRSRSQYSTAFTSWLVVASIALMRSASSTPKSPTHRRSASCVDAENGCMASKENSSLSASSQATSTATRSRISANSLKCSCRGRVLAA